MFPKNMPNQDDTFRMLKKTPAAEFESLLLDFLLDSGFLVEPGMTDTQLEEFLESHGWTLHEVKDFIRDKPFGKL